MWWTVGIHIFITYTRFDFLRYGVNYLESLPCAQMAARPKQDVFIRKQGSLVARASNKRFKQNGAHHAFEWEKLENPDVQAEMGWEIEKKEYKSSKTCMKYVTMYHIDKFWPKECHEAHIKSFACRPWTCKDDHFICCTEEVWRALYGNRVKNKRLLNYSLVLMV
jgi:hypothetical protein